MSNRELFRYDLPSENGEGWAIVVISADGYFSTVSDWGNYAFRWSAFGDRDFRSFLSGLGEDYFLSKVAPTRNRKPLPDAVAFYRKVMPRLRLMMERELRHDSQVES